MNTATEYPDNKDVVSNLSLDLMHGEIFRDVVGYDGLYSVSNFGRVKREFRLTRRGQRLEPKIMKPYFDYNGNQCGVNFTVDNVVKRFTVQQLVANAFIGYTGEDKVAQHKNKDASDNRLCNIEIVDWSTNCKTNFRLGKIDDNITNMALLAVARGQARHDALQTSTGFRICVRCLVEKELTEFPRDGKKAITCIECVSRNKTKEYGIKKVREALLDAGLQRCSKCKSILPLDRFTLHSGKKSKRDSQCKSCWKERYYLKKYTYLTGVKTEESAVEVLSDLSSNGLK